MNWRNSGYALTYVGLAGIVFATVMGLEFAPTIKACTEAVSYTHLTLPTILLE